MPDKLRIIFMGTPDFAVESLKSLANSKHDIVGVITAPDKPAGRGKIMESSAVKKFAEQENIGPILQPESLKDAAFIRELSCLKADLQVVVAFRMLPEMVWAMPEKGTVNLHASLLPDYRGAAPINWVIINGEKETGVTTFFIEKEIDTGHILQYEKVEISHDMDAGQLHDLLMLKGARLLAETVDSIASGDIRPVPQNTIANNKPLHAAPKIFKEDCKINWDQESERIYNFIRGLSPYPAAWTELTDGNKVLPLKIFRSHCELGNHSYDTGAVISDFKSMIKVAVTDGFIVIDNLQQAGKKRMDTVEFLRGFQSLNEYRIVQPN